MLRGEHMRLILIEGVPGSGKSTLAETLCKVALSSGINASWYLEESRDHPVHPHVDKSGKNLTEYYLQQWKNFISVNTGRDHLFILEGSLFQSTVRFMLEAGCESIIHEYFIQCQCLFSSIPVNLVYLRPEDIRSHINWISELRGAQWAGKVSKYLEGTLIAKDHGWHHGNCMNEFWYYYAGVCDSLVENTTIPNQTITSGMGCFESQLTTALDYTKLGHRLSNGQFYNRPQSV